jgi:hypothetical protein
MFEFIARHWQWLLTLWVVCSAALCVSRVAGIISWNWALVALIVVAPLVPAVLMFLVALCWRP